MLYIKDENAYSQQNPWNIIPEQNQTINLDIILRVSHAQHPLEISTISKKV